MNQTEENDDEEYCQLIEQDLAELEASELIHLEEEFEDYEPFHPITAI